MKRLFEPNSYTGVGLQPPAQMNDISGKKISIHPDLPLGQYIETLHKELSAQAELLQQLEGKIAPLLQYTLPAEMKIAGVNIREGQTSPLRGELEALGMRINENNSTISRLIQAVDL